MIILGIDSSAVTCAAALTDGGKVLGSIARRDGLTHSETLLPGIASLMKEAGLSFHQLDAIAVSAGPGSFTGLRIGIATAKGLSYDKNLPCVPVSTLEALGENASHLEGETICAVMDARRGEFYNAVFRVENGLVKRLTPDRAIGGDALLSELKGERKVIVLGDGAEKFVHSFPDPILHLAPEEIRWQSAVSVCLLAERRYSEDYVSCRALSPRYLRLPQAEREWRRTHTER